MLYAAGLRPGSPDAERLREIVAGDLDDQTAIDTVAAQIRASGAVDAAMDVAASYIERAKQCVASVPSMETRELLEELADFALTRSS
jgi:geranylgeranyl pyrophosphate synthase